MLICDDRPIITTAKRLPVAICLDVSPSRGGANENGITSIEMINDLVWEIIQALNCRYAKRAHMEVACITSGHVNAQKVEFRGLGTLSRPCFSTTETEKSELWKTVSCAMDVINTRVKQYNECEIGHYSPLLIFVTDGVISEKEDLVRYNEAIALLHDQCDISTTLAELVVPVVIGIDNKRNEPYIRQFLGGNMRDYFCCKNATETLAQWLYRILSCIYDPIRTRFGTRPRPISTIDILESLRKTDRHLQDRHSDVFSTLENDMKALLAELSGDNKQ